MIEHSLSAWATALGFEARTLERKLARVGVDHKKGERIRAKQIAFALVGEKEMAEVREKTARAVKLERDNAEAAGDTVRMESVNRIISDVMLPIRQRIMSLPSISNLCNPTDPEFARAALQTFADETWPLLRKEVKKLKGPNGKIGSSAT